jgi:TIR domain
MKLFISYSRHDKKFAKQLAKSLTERGGDAWLSEHGMLAGDDWLTTLKDRLKITDAFVLVMPSTTAVSSNSTFARAIGKDVVIVVPDLEEVDRTNIPYDLARTVVVDASKQPIENVAETVLGAVRH